MNHEVNIDNFNLFKTKNTSEKLIAINEIHKYKKAISLLYKEFITKFEIENKTETIDNKYNFNYMDTTEFDNNAII